MEVGRNNCTMKKIIAMILLSSLFSCEKEKAALKYDYFYSTELELKEPSKKDISYSAVTRNDSVYIYHNLSAIDKYRYTVNSDGIFVVQGDKLSNIYSFQLNKKIIRNEELTKFFFREVQMVEKKDYVIDDIKYTLYHFIESNRHETLDSYFMEGEGFICFYRYSEDRFLYLNSPKSLKVSKTLLNDNSFFALLKMRKIDKGMGRKFN